MKSLTLLIFLFFVIHLNVESAFGQSETKTFVSQLIPHSVTYNGSDDPNECVESVEWGLLVNTDTGRKFFVVNYSALEKVRTSFIDTLKAEITVVYDDQPDPKTGSSGSVLKITKQGELIYGQK